MEQGLVATAVAWSEELSEGRTSFSLEIQSSNECQSLMLTCPSPDHQR